MPNREPRYSKLFNRCASLYIVSFRYSIRTISHNLFQQLDISVLTDEQNAQIGSDGNEFEAGEGKIYVYF